MQLMMARLVTMGLIALAWLFARGACAGPAEALFRYATNAYYAGEYKQAAGAFAQAASLQPAGGTLQNFGNAEWQSGQVGMAILAWEQTLWLDPFNRFARANLQFGRRVAQLEIPELSWYEVVSSWLPADWWAWVAALSLWSSVAMSTVPGILRRRKASWQQAAAAFGLAIFLLSVPAQFGVHSRARLGFILAKDVPLRLTPTSEAQYITRLPSGEWARFEQSRGKYLRIRTGHADGWVQKDEFKLVCSNADPIVSQIQAKGTVP